LELTAEFAGVATSYAFEHCFRPGGQFGGVEQLGPASYLLAEGEGCYRVGEDVIAFGPGGGSGPQQPAQYDPGGLHLPQPNRRTDLAAGLHHRTDTRDRADHSAGTECV
jgi:hypothetical protein